jgi:putative phosphoribosyl transferase
VTALLPLRPQRPYREDQSPGKRAVMKFRNRQEAGRLLASQLSRYANRSDVVVLAIPPGGVPVGYEIADSLDSRLDVFVIRRITLSGERQTVGAVGPGGLTVLDHPLIHDLRIPIRRVDEIAGKEQLWQARMELMLRDGRGRIPVAGRTAILVSDGARVAADIMPAVEVLALEKPSRLIVALPVAGASVAAELEQRADELVCLSIAQTIGAVPRWYDDRREDNELKIRSLLQRGSELPRLARSA